MRGWRTGICAGAAIAALLIGPATAGAATPVADDVPTSFWARTQVVWSVTNGWMTQRTDGTFSPAFAASRLAAARVLANLYRVQTGTPVAADPYAQAVAATWIPAGTGPADTITQLDFDRGVVAVLALRGAAIRMNGIQAADGWKPRLPLGFGSEQVVKAIGARANAPWPYDAWETWPGTLLRRANLAVEAYRLAHLSPWWRSSLTSLEASERALPTYTPLQKAVLGFAFSYATAPYVWGGTSNGTQILFGHTVPGGFDCSGYVWWVMKLHTYTANGFTWTGNAAIPWRTTYDMAQHLPYARRIPRASLQPGDIVFWSSAPRGALTSYTTVYHTGIYLGNGWTINSHGDGDGVTLNSMASGWYHDAFAFGWRVLPAGH